MANSVIMLFFRVTSMTDKDEMLERVLFMLDELLMLINDGCENRVAIEALVRLCGYHCEAWLIESGRVGIVKSNASDWLV